jgi:hypothetical protein
MQCNKQSLIEPSAGASLQMNLQTSAPNLILLTPREGLTGTAPFAEHHVKSVKKSGFSALFFCIQPIKKRCSKVESEPLSRSGASHYITELIHVVLPTRPEVAIWIPSSGFRVISVWEFLGGDPGTSAIFLVSPVSSQNWEISRKLKRLEDLCCKVVIYMLSFKCQIVSCRLMRR